MTVVSHRDVRTNLSAVEPPRLSNPYRLGQRVCRVELRREMPQELLGATRRPLRSRAIGPKSRVCEVLISKSARRLSLTSEGIAQRSGIASRTAAGRRGWWRRCDGSQRDVLIVRRSASWWPGRRLRRGCDGWGTRACGIGGFELDIAIRPALRLDAIRLHRGDARSRRAHFEVGARAAHLAVVETEAAARCRSCGGTPATRVGVRSPSSVNKWPAGRRWRDATESLEAAGHGRSRECCSRRKLPRSHHRIGCCGRRNGHSRDGRHSGRKRIG